MENAIVELCTLIGVPVASVTAILTFVVFLWKEFKKLRDVVKDNKAEKELQKQASNLSKELATALKENRELRMKLTHVYEKPIEEAKHDRTDL